MQVQQQKVTKKDACFLIIQGMEDIHITIVAIISMVWEVVVMEFLKYSRKLVPILYFHKCRLHRTVDIQHSLHMRKIWVIKWWCMAVEPFWIRHTPQHILKNEKAVTVKRPLATMICSLLRIHWKVTLSTLNHKEQVRKLLKRTTTHHITTWFTMVVVFNQHPYIIHLYTVTYHLKKTHLIKGRS